MNVGVRREFKNNSPDVLLREDGAQSECVHVIDVITWAVMQSWPRMCMYKCEQYDPRKHRAAVNVGKSMGHSAVATSLQCPSFFVLVNEGCPDFPTFLYCQEKHQNFKNSLFTARTGSDHLQYTQYVHAFSWLSIRSNANLVNPLDLNF